jgi:predicted MPP superfamily phosphohydrolase
MWRKTIDRIEVVATTLPIRQLPSAFAGVVACQISDLHLDREEDLARLDAAVKAINRQNPDLVFLTGDYFSGGDTMRRYADDFRRAVAELNPRTGTFAILGNHDHWASASVVSDALKKGGAQVLTNEHQRVMLNGEQLIVVGIDDLWARKAEPARAFRGLAPDDCTIVLAHNPDTALYARHLAPGVMLSGHTHGGVVRIPYYGSPIRSILRIGKQFYAGLNRYNEFYIYTNRGLGTFWLRIRINCRPEISRFSLALLEERVESATPLVERRRRSGRVRAAG